MSKKIGVREARKKAFAFASAQMLDGDLEFIFGDDYYAVIGTSGEDVLCDAQKWVAKRIAMMAGQTP